MDNVACAGTESRLIDCPFDRHTADCVHSEDAGVRCQEGEYNFNRSLKIRFDRHPLFCGYTKLIGQWASCECARPLKY